MAKVPKMKYEINLREIFGTDVQDRALREAIAQTAIDKIVERTRSGTSLRGTAFKGYSKSYQDSHAFKAFGKDGTIDLTLTGDMLDQLTVIESTDAKVALGWSDSTQNAKAYNHNVGDTLPKREFFGLQAQEIAEIRETYKEAVMNFSELEQAKGTGAFDQKAVEILTKLMEAEVG